MDQALATVKAAREEVFKVELLSPARLEHYWPNIQEQLELIPHTWEKWWTIDSLQYQAFSGNMQVWAVGTPNTVHLVVFTRIACYPVGLLLQCFLAFGNNLRRSLPILVASLQKYAMDNGCYRAEVYGRSGWVKTLEKFGFEFENVVMAMDIRKEGIH